METLDLHLRYLEDCIAFLEGEAPPAGLLASLAPGPRLHSPESFEVAVERARADELAEAVTALREERAELHAELDALKARCDRLRPWLDCPLPLHRLAELESCGFELGWLPASVLPDEVERLERRLEGAVILPFGGDDRGRFLVALAHRSVLDDLRHELRLLAFEEREFPEVDRPRGRDLARRLPPHGRDPRRARPQPRRGKASGGATLSTPWPWPITGGPASHACAGKPNSSRPAMPSAPTVGSGPAIFPRCSGSCRTCGHAPSW